MPHWINCENTLAGAIYWMADQEQDHATLPTIPPADCLWAVEFLTVQVIQLASLQPPLDPVQTAIKDTAEFLWGKGG